MQPIFRFAPSPSGFLHIGHAYSALLNHDIARRAGGRVLLRIEDIDSERSRPEYTTAIIEDCEWLGLHFERPIRRQSEHIGSAYTVAEWGSGCGAKVRHMPPATSALPRDSTAVRPISSIATTARWSSVGAGGGSAAPGAAVSAEARALTRERRRVEGTMWARKDSC